MLVSRDTINTAPSGKIYVDSLSFIEGIIFSSGYTDFRGALYGSVITRNFYYYQMPTTYINWLRHAYIDRSRLVYNRVMPLTYVVETDFCVFSAEYR